MWDQLLVWLRDVPPLLMYAVLGMGAAIENIVPPIPADTFVLLGGFLAARGSALVGVVFLVTWTANVLSALAVYAVAYKYGEGFFQGRFGKYLLNPKQVGIVERFYLRWGSAAIFYTRFLPGLRAVAPVFAGLTRQRPRSVVFPLVLASAIWYGALIWIGAFAGRNFDQLLSILARIKWVLAGIAAVVVVLVAWWWVRSRRSPGPRGDGAADPVPDGKDGASDPVPDGDESEPPNG